MFEFGARMPFSGKGTSLLEVNGRLLRQKNCGCYYSLIYIIYQYYIQIIIYQNCLRFIKNPPMEVGKVAVKFARLKEVAKMPPFPIKRMLLP